MKIILYINTYIICVKSKNIMAYKKQILEKYKQSIHKSKELPYKSNNFDTIDTLKNHISLLRYQNFKLINKNKDLKQEIKQDIKYWEPMHWELIEDIKYSEFLYNKINTTSNKRKLYNTYMKKPKKITKIKKQKTNNVIVIYDSDNDTITDSDSEDIDLINDIEFISSYDKI